MNHDDQTKDPAAFYMRLTQTVLAQQEAGYASSFFGISLAQRL